MSEVISSFRSLRAGSQVFALLMLFLCVILHTMWSGKRTTPKPNKDINNGISYRPISLLSVIADNGEEPSSLHNSKPTKHTHATRVQNTTLHSDGTTHIKQHRSKGVQPNCSPCANNHCSTRYEQSFRHNKHYTH